MVQAAQTAGYKYIGISDHSQSSFYAQGLKGDRLLEQSELIKKLQKKVKIKIFHGIESDILADGALDYPEDVLARFDFIVGSIHNRFQMQGPEMTKRIVNALKHPRVTIWGHPTGRLLLGRKAYEIDWDACVETAAKHGVAVEFNANPQRLDVDWRQGPLLEKNNAWVCVNPDAHSVEGILDTLYGEAMAEKAMVSRERILNLKSADEVEEYLWQRKQKK